MFAKVRAHRHERNRSSSAASSPSSAVPPPLVSPLQMNFDLDLPGTSSPLPSQSSPYRISGDSLSLSRPGTSDGLGDRHKSGLSFRTTAAAPVLPPIPRVASRYEPSGGGRPQETRSFSDGSLLGKNSSSNSRARDDNDNTSACSFGSRKSQVEQHAATFEHPVDMMPTSMTMSSLDASRPSTSGGSTPKMESSLFPPRSAAGSPVLPPINSGPPMSRAFIDSRDKPYSYTPARTSSQQTQQSTSSVRTTTSPGMKSLQSPAMHSLQSPASYSSHSSHSPLSPQMPTPSSAMSSPNVLLTPSSATSLRPPKISGARLSPSSSVEDLRVPKISGARLSPSSSIEDLRAQMRSPTISGARLSPSSSKEDLRAQMRSPTSGTTATNMTTMSRTPTSGTMATTASTSYSGSTALPSPHSSVAKPAYSPSAHSPLVNTANLPLANTAQSPLANTAQSPLANIGQSPLANSAHPSLTSTIGTPYAATSASFPLPQHVATRPKTAGAVASVAGVNVPTHHTSAPRPDSMASTTSTSGSTKDKRKTRVGLLNPMALLVRRKSSQQDGASTTSSISPVDVGRERSAAAQAYARQKSVAAVGVSRIPEDFDPRIRGKVVHDFSAPRPSASARRQFSYNDAESLLDVRRERDSEGGRPGLAGSLSSGAVFAANGAATDGLSSGGGAQHSKNTSESSSAGGHNRRSTGSPSMFRELLHEHDYSGDHHRREGSLNAERLENKGFLQRVSLHSSSLSQESAVLPPFARRSQYLDAMGWSDEQDGQSKRSSDPSSLGGRERDSTASSHASMPSLNGVVSPVTARSSGNGGVKDGQLRDSFGHVKDRELRDSLGQSLSPVSPRSMQHHGLRPFSAISVDLPVLGLDPEAPRVRSESEATARPVEGIAVQARERSATTRSEDAPEVLDTGIAVPDKNALSIPIPDRDPSSIGTTPDLTPEIAQAESLSIPASSPRARVVEKRASAVGHVARAAPSAGLPKHQASNASRFSFQFGESRAEEEALEEKHRKIKGLSVQPPARQMSPDEDEDEFDEGAMDDMDEFEQQEEEQRVGPPPAVSGALLGLQQARRQLQAAPSESDDGSVYDDEEGEGEGVPERELTYAEHPDIRAHSVLMSAYSGTSPESAKRGASDASALTLNTTNLPTTGGASGASFYMQPKAAGYSPQAGSPLNEKPPLPHRDSGNSERNRVASGMSFNSVEAARHARVASGGTVGSGVGSSHEARPVSISGLGLSGLGLSANANRATSGSETNPHRLSRWEDLDKHTSRGTPPPQDTRKSVGAGYFNSPESHGHSAAYRGTIGNNIRARNSAINQNSQYADSDSGDEAGHDDLYYDDGGFEQDLKGPKRRHDSLDENEFDNSAFLQRARMGGIMGHQRDASGLSFASLGSDGPYPSFAMGANPVKTLHRQSELLLHDLPLQGPGPVDPKLIPQRNPSEDAKRLGLSSKVPPLPVPAQEGSKEAMMRMQANLQDYHATLADALNKAAAEGRFQRQLSVASSMARSESAYSRIGDDDRSHYSRDDGSHYSKDESGNAHDEDGARGLAVQANAEPAPSMTASKDTSESRMDQRHTHSPPKLDFDFGFSAGGGLMDDAPEYDDLGLDDDMVAAANGEVLASDDEGFYGQEFGFYAHARPNSGEVQAINGGFFGEDGDDGLARNKSLKEPNLTPITERSEFSTRNSFINTGHGAAFGLPSAGLGPASPSLARLAVSPLVEGEATSFDQLRKLRANAFGGNDGNTGSGEYGPGKGPGSYAWHAAHSRGPRSPSVGTTKVPSTVATQGGGYFSGFGGESTGLSEPPSATRSLQAQNENPQSATVKSMALPFAGSQEATPKKPVPTTVEPPDTVRKASAPAYMNGGGPTHARKGSDSVTYVEEQDPAGGGSPRWVLERRRTSAQGQLELVGREVVQGGWI